MDVYSLLEAIRVIAVNGLNYSQNPYDRERYDRLMDLTAQSYSDLLNLPPAEIRARFLREIGYVTPKVGADAALFNPRGEILLMQRADGSGWCLPCGWVEPGESPEEAAVREAREETGLQIEVQQLVGVFTRKPGAQHGPHTTVSVVYLCQVTAGEMVLSHEGLALRYWPLDKMQHWHSTHAEFARAAYAAWQAGR